MKKMENIQKFAELVKAHPSLPVYAMVDSEVVVDDGYCFWLGQIETTKLGEIAVYGERCFDDRDDFKEIYFDRNEDELCEKFNYTPSVDGYAFKYGYCTEEEYEKNEVNEKRLDAYLDEVAQRAFTESIVVYVDRPDLSELTDKKEN